MAFIIDVLFMTHTFSFEWLMMLYICEALYLNLTYFYYDDTDNALRVEFDQAADSWNKNHSHSSHRNITHITRYSSKVSFAFIG